MTAGLRWTLPHLPCLSRPGGAGAAGMPLGGQFVARRGGDATLLVPAARMARALDQARCGGTRSGLESQHL